jgi:uncharacterized protein YjbI with pentapeptide repeats
MSNLLVDKALGAEPKPETKGVARLWTFTTVRRINGERKGIVLHFLHEASLIHSENPIIDLVKADFSNARLFGADLSGANLGGVNFQGANLKGANLKGTILKGARLSRANLAGASLVSADLSDADLGGADLGRADFTQAQYSKETVWPGGFDPVRAGAILVGPR